MRIATSILGLLALLIAAPAFAVDRLVDNELRPCISGSLPIHATISDAIRAASPGETILVCEGDYTETVVVSKANLTLRTQGIVHVKAADPTQPGLHVGANGVTVQGFDISGATGNPFDPAATSSSCGVFVEGVKDADIRDNVAHDNRIGICVTGTDHRVRYNVIESNTDYGIVMRSSGAVEVSNNIVKNNHFSGIFAFQCVDGASSVTLDHNVIMGSPLGVQIGASHHSLGCKGALITNNTFRGPGALMQNSVGILVYYSDGAVLTRNAVQDTGSGLFLWSTAGITASFNSISFNHVGLRLVLSTDVTATRNNVSRSTTVDCRWDGFGANVLTNNSCGTQDPPGAFD